MLKGIHLNIVAHIVYKPTLLHHKAVSHAINSHVLTGKNPCINKEIHVLLIHGFAVLRISIPGPSQKHVNISNVQRSERNFVTSG